MTLQFKKMVAYCYMGFRKLYSTTSRKYLEEDSARIYFDPNFHFFRLWKFLWVWCFIKVDFVYLSKFWLILFRFWITISFIILLSGRKLLCEPVVERADLRKEQLVFCTLFLLSLMI